jgi:hypothetical protein
LQRQHENFCGSEEYAWNRVHGDIPEDSSDEQDDYMNDEALCDIGSDHFSLDLYRGILERAIQLGYSFPTVSELKAGTRNLGKFLLLRHDIDTSPHYALQMVLLEHKLGVRSSCYVLMHSPFYNPAAPQHWNDLRKIVDLGFEVGLHYETDFFEQRNIDPLKGVLDDVAALEKILQVTIKSVSQHRPASGTFLKQLNEFYVDAYNEDLMQNVRYISDSGFKWRGETLADLLGKEDRIHALIHPLTWSFEDLDMAGTYQRASEEITAGIRQSFADFIVSTNLYLKKRQQLDRARKAQYVSEANPSQ